LVAFSAKNRFYRDNRKLGRIFIRANIEPIAREWEEFAKTCTPAAIGTTKSALLDDVTQILEAVADDMEQPQTPAEQSKRYDLGPWTDGQTARP
jgi:hypothetical protein